MKAEIITDKEKNNEFFMETYDQLPITIEYGKGACLYDEDGKEYIDFTSGIGASSIGYKNEGLEKALHEQIDKILHVSNIVFNKPSLDASKKIIDASDMKKVFFSNSGTEANECAIKIARKYSLDKYGENRNVIISLRESFHGRTMGSLMATGVEKYQKDFFKSPQDFKYIKRNDIKDLKDNIDESVCAIMIEIIQGEAGVYPLQKDFIEEVQYICREKDIILICDEVQCGIGRSGKLFAYEYFDIEPDIVTSAKGLGAGIPVGATLSGEKAAMVLGKGSHGSTFGGNPLAMTAVNEVLQQIEEPGFYEDVKEKGNIIIEYLKNLNKNTIIEVRGCGLMIGIETILETSEIQKEALEKGLLVLTAGKDVIRLLPPLTISKEELYKGLNILKDCF